jgi:hypothetical protein
MSIKMTYFALANNQPFSELGSLRLQTGGIL